MATQALAPPQLVDVTLSLFGGRKTDIAPSDCPEGITPDEQDGVYVPGGWFSRPGLSKLYPNGISAAGTQVLYEKTYIQPNNDPLTLVLTSDGQLWVEDVGNSPLVLNSIFQAQPGLYAQSVTADGREYIAFSDLLHGQGVPLQYVAGIDGVPNSAYLDRVTQDGPGAGPTIADFQGSLAISEIGQEVIAARAITASPTGATFAGSLTGTVNTDSTGLLVTWVSGSTFTQSLNGTFIVVNGLAAEVLTVTSSTTLTLASVIEASQSGVNYSATLANIATITTLGAHGYIPGNIVFLQGVGVKAYNGLQTIETVPSATTFTFALDISSLANSGGGEVSQPLAQAYTELSSITGPPQINVGDYIVITGSGGGLDSNIAGNPANWQVTNVFYDSSVDLWAIGFTFATAPQTVAVTTATSGRVFLGGQSSPGIHQCVVMFLTRNGSLTPPSPPIAFTSAGNTQWQLNNIATGPANVVARVLGFTGAGGDNFFTIPENVTLPNPTGQDGITPSGLAPVPVVVKATVVPDNTSTTAIFDVPDNTLFAAIAIDQVGNDLFDQRVLGPVLGFFSYASRLMCWGDYQKVENLLNMSFCGGPVGAATPLGWTQVTAGGVVFVGGLDGGGPWPDGQTWHITGSGVSGAFVGQISQSGYQDASGDPILLPNTYYTFRIWAKNPSLQIEGLVCCQLYSASAGFIGTASMPVSQFSARGNFAEAPFQVFDAGTDKFVTVATPSVIPPDIIVTIFDQDTVLDAVIDHAEVQLVYTQNPYNNTLVRASYPENPEGIAQTTGNLGAADDDSAVQCLALLRKPALLETLEGVHIFQDNGGEPNTWQVDSVTRAVGAVSLRGGDPGKFGTGDAAEDWAMIASKNGVYLFAGAEFWKVSQEISRGALPQSQDPRPTWDDINWDAQQTIVAKNDPSVRRAYFAVPINGATQPNVVFVLDYREMDTATQIASAPPVHITIQGKMKSSDLTRKWSVWNISANDLEILVRPGNQRELVFAGGPRNGAAYSNIYSLDSANLSDDDYGQIFPYYTTYAFTDHDQEQALNLGSDLHLYKKIHSFVAGVGWVTITPIVNSLYNFQPGLQARQLTADLDPSTFLASDLEWTVEGLKGQRVFFRISVQPLFPSTTDVQIRLQKFVVGMMKHPIAMTRQSSV